MKKIIITCFLIIFITYQANSQTEQGSKMIGGSGYIRFESPFSIGLSPNVGFFVVNNLALGTGAQLYYFRDDLFSNTALGMNPFVRYYIGKSQTRIFAQGSVGYVRLWRRSFDQRDEVISSTGQLQGYLDLGLSRFISKQVAFELALNYTQTLEADPQRRLNLNLGFQIFLPSSRE